MKNKLQVFKELTKSLSKSPLTAQQGLRLSIPAKGQLHRPPHTPNLPDVFLLITNVETNYCDVIPGSMDCVMAGDCDIVLPKNVMGNYVFLSLDMAATLPLSSIGEGFACLDDVTYNRIIDSQIFFETGEPTDTSPFLFALPYIGKFDSRIEYHIKMRSMMESLQEPLRKLIFE